LIVQATEASVRCLLLVVVLQVWAASAAAETAAPASCSRVETSQDRTLCHEVVVAAPVAEVWRLISTSEGWRAWAAPVAEIDLRSGGRLETSYRADARIGDAANIRNRVLAFTPERLLVIQIASAPPGFPHADLARELTTALELEPVDAGHTRVRVTMMGYRDGAGFDALYAFFDRGNAATLAALNAHIERRGNDQ
jgi:uncharacterized protein YndB with AHSA1/START domain